MSEEKPAPQTEEKSDDKCHCNDDERGHERGGIWCLEGSNE